jgi:hypothetical protein
MIEGDHGHSSAWSRSRILTTTETIIFLQAWCALRNVLQEGLRCTCRRGCCLFQDLLARTAYPLWIGVVFPDHSFESFNQFLFGDAGLFFVVRMGISFHGPFLSPHPLNSSLLAFLFCHCASSAGPPGPVSPHARNCSAPSAQICPAPC